VASGHGGRRPGAGRKPKFKAIDGGASAPVPEAGAPLPSTNSDAGGAEPLPGEWAAPDDLSPDERKVWLKLAPHAVARQTLTKATAFQFELLCRNVVLERDMATDQEQRGTANHRGLIQRIDAELLRFDLSPNGKPHGAVPGTVAKPKSRLELLQERRKGLHAVG
jgi:hypothetical protein